MRPRSPSAPPRRRAKSCNSRLACASTPRKSASTTGTAGSCSTCCASWPRQAAPPDRSRRYRQQRDGGPTRGAGASACAVRARWHHHAPWYAAAVPGGRSATAIAAALGFGEVLCTEVEWDGERLVGTLTTPNRRGVEKVRCLAQLRARHPQLPITAYGNTPGDLAHLGLADRGVLVNGSRRARRAARRAGVDCRVWR